MRDHDIRDRVQRKGQRNRRFSAEDLPVRVEIGGTRNRVAVIIGHMRRLWGLVKTRLMALARTHAQFQIAAVGWILQSGTKFRRMFA